MLRLKKLFLDGFYLKNMFLLLWIKNKALLRPVSLKLRIVWHVDLKVYELSQKRHFKERKKKKLWVRHNNFCSIVKVGDTAFFFCKLGILTTKDFSLLAMLRVWHCVTRLVPRKYVWTNLDFRFVQFLQAQEIWPL